MNTTDNNKRIVKNTIYLYVRMLFLAGISLYSSRIVLSALGIEDYGIYNIVGGLVVLFTFLNNALTTSTQRFLNFEIGKGDLIGAKKIFSLSLTMYIVLILLIILVSETLGLWFLNNKLNIPHERIMTANWVYQFSIITFCILLIKVPYNAAILAYERMSFYSFVSIIEALLKLSIIYLLIYIETDKLKLYSILVSVVISITLLIYIYYCITSFEICTYNLFLDLVQLKKLLNFSGWSLFGSFSNMLAQEGLNILINIFYGVSINAAMGIANSVGITIYSFVSNFQSAFNPQIVKSYASNERNYFIKLVFQTSKFSYFLMLILAIPFLICTEFILQIWLHQVPDFSANFCRLIVLFMLVEAISAPLWMSVQASGNIRNYQVIMGLLIFLNFPLSFIFLKMGFQPYIILVLRFIINIISFAIRIKFFGKLMKLQINDFLSNVVWVALLVTVLSLPLPMLANHFISNWTGFLITILVSLFSTLFSIYFIGIEKHERLYLRNRLQIMHCK